MYGRPSPATLRLIPQVKRSLTGVSRFLYFYQVSHALRSRLAGILPGSEAGCALPLSPVFAGAGSSQPPLRSDADSSGTYLR